MNAFLIQTILAANSDDVESTFWVQILVFVLLAASWGVYSLAKTKRNKYEDEYQNLVDETSTHRTKYRRQSQPPHKHIAQIKGIVQKYATKTQERRLHLAELRGQAMLDFDKLDIAGHEKVISGLAQEKGKDLNSGMELLGLDFLLSIVENTEGNDENDVTMRKLTFNELLRRKEQYHIKSSVLKTYAINQGNLYGKNIQCEAIKGLSERTMHTRQHSV